MSDKYLFTSERLGFRNWIDSDIAKMIDISSDPDVMEFFPATATKIQAPTPKCSNKIRPDDGTRGNKRRDCRSTKRSERAWCYHADHWSISRTKPPSFASGTICSPF